MEKQIEEYLYTHIPVAMAMGIKVEEASPQRVILTAPLDVNINHKQTVFGGSLHAVATLACWSLLYINLRLVRKDDVQIVIASSNVDYLAPIDADFRVECCVPNEAIWERFIKMLESKGKARIQLSSTIVHKGRLAVDYRGMFVAIGGK